MSRIRNSPGPEEKFFLLSDAFARDPRVTPRAARVYIYLRSHRSGWDTNVRRISAAIGMGKNSVNNAINDLEELGYVERVQVRGEDGQFTEIDYVVHSQPCPQNRDTDEGEQNEPDNRVPKSGNPESGNPESGNPETGTHKGTIPKGTKDKGTIPKDPPVVPQGGHDDEPGAEVEIVSDSTPAAPGDGDTSPAGKQKRGTRLDPGFFPSEQTIATVRSRFPGMSPQFMEYEHEKFHDHWAQASGRTAAKRDWDAAWRNWMRTAVDRLRPAERAQMFGHGPTPQPPAPTAPSKADQYRDIGDMVAAEFAQGGDGQ